jgi:ketosteroid isomerase-like protein
MMPSMIERDELLKGFSRALFKNDLEALDQVVASDFLWSFHDGLTMTKSLASAAAIRAHLAGQKALFSTQRFHEVAYHHSPDITFMTFRVSETLRETGEQREQRGVECYSFEEGRIKTKDVYRKPIRFDR